MPSFKLTMELWSIPIGSASASILITLSFVLVVLTKVLMKISKINRSTASRIPPGPRKIPFLGNIHLLVGYMPHERLRELALKYGPLMHLQFGEVSQIVISSPEYAKLVMKTHDTDFANRPKFFRGDVMFYNSTNIAFSPLGDYWRLLRRICTSELLDAKHVQSFQRIREEIVSDLIKSISSGGKGPVNLSEMIYSSTYTFTSRVTIGIKRADQEGFISTAKKSLAALGGFNIADIYPSVKLFQYITQMRLGLRKLHRELDTTLQNIIDKHMAKRETRDETRCEDEAEYLVDTLLNLREHGNLEPPLTIDNIKAVIMDLFVAGSDTPATAVEWAMSELVKNPRVMKKAQDEVRQALDTLGYGNVSESDIHRLEYLKLVIKETLRLHPPLPFLLPREARERYVISGYEIPAKSRVLINAWAIGRDPLYWTEPERFYPERFLESSIDYKGSHFELIPFGSGRRICPGMSFGMVNAELQLAMMLYHFDWKLPDGANLENLDMTEAFGATLRRENDLLLIPIPYIPSSAS